MNILQRVKAEYYIIGTTPVGRIDWAINDFMAQETLSTEEKNVLIMATAEEVRCA